MAPQSILEARLDLLHSDVSDVKKSLDKLADAITKLALVEERQINLSAAQERGFIALERLEARLNSVELRIPENSRTTIWLDRLVWSSAAVGVAAVLKQVAII
jgi:hypothetical protein